MAPSKSKLISRNQPIITAFLKNISGEIFEQRKDIIQQLMQGQQGVYVMYAKGRLYYVGKATNLKNRMKAHLKDHHAGKWDLFSAFLVRDAAHVGELEALFLNIVHPEGNAKSQRLPLAENLNAELIRQVREHAQGEIKGLSQSARALPGHSSRPAKTAKQQRSRIEKSQGGMKGIHLFREYKGVMYHAKYIGNDKVLYAGEVMSPSGAALAVTGSHANGWRWWKCERDGEVVELREVR